tara:strand:- start:26719 stop:31311 length:4593 start_codon:yes stop_codon:yes gene_type:complete
VSDLGKATIKIDVDVVNIKSTKSKLDNLFNHLERKLDSIDFYFDAIDDSLNNLGRNKGLIRLGRIFALATKVLRNMRMQVDLLDTSLNSLNVPRTVKERLLRTEEATEKLVAQLKRANLELKAMKRNAPKNPIKAPAGGIGGGIGSNMIRGGQMLKQGGADMMRFAAISGLAFGLVIKEGAKYEQELINVASVISGLTDGSVSSARKIGELSQKFEQLGRTTEYSATQVASAGRQLALSGFGTDEIIDSMDAITSLASATNTELEKTAQIAARITRAFQLTADSSLRLADILASVASNSNTTLEGLGESFKLGAPIAAAYGQSVEDVAVAFGVLGDSGIQNSRAGTGISRLLSELTEKKGDIKELLAPFGDASDKLDPMANSITDIVKEFETLINTGKLTKAQLFDIFDQRSARSLVSMINTGSAAFENLSSQIEAGKALEIRDFRVDNTISGQFKILQSAISASAISITQSLQPAIVSFLKYAQQVVNAITSWVSANTELVVKIGKTVAIVIAAAAGMGVFLIAIGGLLTAVGSLTITFVTVAPHINKFWIAIKALAGSNGLGGLMKVLGKSKVWTFLVGKTAMLKWLGPIGIIIAGFLAWFDLLNKALRSFGYKGFFADKSAETKAAMESMGAGAKQMQVAFFQASLEIKNMQKEMSNLVGKKDAMLRFGSMTAIALKNIVGEDGSDQSLFSTDDMSKETDDMMKSGSVSRNLEQKRKSLQASINEDVGWGWWDSAETKEAKAKIKGINEQLTELNKVYREGRMAVQEYRNSMTALGSDDAVGFGLGLKIQKAEAEKELEAAQDGMNRQGIGSPTEETANKQGRRLNEAKTNLEEITKKAKEAESALKGASAAQLEQLRLINEQWKITQDDNTTPEARNKAREKEILLTRELMDLKLMESKRAEDSASSAADIKKAEEARHAFTRDTLKGNAKLVASLEDRYLRVDEAIAKAVNSQQLLLEIAKDEIDLLDNRSLAVSKAIEDPTKEFTGERKIIIEKELSSIVKSRAEVMERINGKEGESAGILATQLDLSQQQEATEKERLERLNEINEKSRDAQIAMLRTAEELKAKQEGNFSDQLQLLKEKLLVEKESQLKKFDENKISDETLVTATELADQAARRLDLEKALTQTMEYQLTHFLDIKKGAESLLGIYKSIEDSLLSQDELSKTKIDREAEARETKIIEEAEILKNQIDALEKQKMSLSPEQKVDLKNAKDALSKKDDMIKKNEQKRSKDQIKREKNKKDKVDEYIRDSDIKAAEMAGDLQKELALTRIKREKENSDEIEAMNIESATDKSKVQLQKALELDEELKKLEETRMKEKEKDTDKKGKKAAKISNTVAKERDKIEDSVLQKLIDQVKTLHQAKAILIFMAKMDSAKRERAKREGRSMLSSSRALNSLKSQRSEALANGESTKILDNKIARAEIDLAVQSAYAAQSFEAVGASASSLTTTINLLNGRLNAGKGTTTAKGVTPPLGKGKKGPLGNIVSTGGGVVNPVFNFEIPNYLGDETELATNIKIAVQDALEQAVT